MINALQKLFFCFYIPVLCVATLIFYCTDEEPLVLKNWQLTTEDIKRAEQIISASRLRKRGAKSLTLSEKDLNIAASYILKRFITSHSKITLNRNRINLLFSIKLPENFFGKYLNIKFNLSKKQGLPIIQNLAFGNFGIANELAGLIIETIINNTQLKQYYVLLLKHIKGIFFGNNKITITYFMTPASYIEAQNYLLQHTDDNIFAVYQRELNNILGSHYPRQKLTLYDLLQPLFRLALDRSLTHDAIAENRAIILVISAYVNSHEVFKFLSYDQRRRPIIYPVYLYDRSDMAKHFMTMAALTSSGISFVAHLLGQEKEIIDADKGSGFSFIDLAANRAGMYFGKTAISSPENAHKFQIAMANIKSQSDFMPDVRDLPENMNNAQFKAQFISIYSPAYQALLKIIDTRISATPLYTFQLQ